MSYRMPTLKYKDRALVYFTASKKHMSFYPSSWAIDEFKDRLQGYKTSAHAIQFTLDKPLPTELIEDLVLFHKRQIDEDRHWPDAAPKRLRRCFVSERLCSTMTGRHAVQHSQRITARTAASDRRG